MYLYLTRMITALYRQSSHARMDSKYNDWIILITSKFCVSEDLCTGSSVYGHENKIKKQQRNIKIATTVNSSSVNSFHHTTSLGNARIFTTC
jgi:hypothetical protein